VLRTVCTVVGVVVLYSAVVAAVWVSLVRVAHSRARSAADRRAAAPAPGPPDGAERRARSWEELPSWLWRDRAWAVAVVLLGAPAVRVRTAPFVDFEHRRIDWPGLLEECRGWPPDQRTMVRSAYEMAFQAPTGATRAVTDPVSLRDVVVHLDDHEVERIRVAMQIRRGRLEPAEAITALG